MDEITFYWIFPFKRVCAGNTSIFAWFFSPVIAQEFYDHCAFLKENVQTCITYPQDRWQTFDHWGNLNKVVVQTCALPLHSNLWDRRKQRCMVCYPFKCIYTHYCPVQVKGSLTSEVFHMLHRYVRISAKRYSNISNSVFIG